ncbi:MAG: hypothetical protein KA586_06475 [Candidatus Promineofilum sp.]|nr:hypothetical protein [Promineifilum sp.]
MDFIADNLVLLPIAMPLVGAMVALVIRRYGRAQAYWSLAVMLLSLMFSFLLLVRVLGSGTAVVLQVGGWRFPYGISLVGDPLSALFAVMAQLVLSSGLIYALGSKDMVITYPPFYPLFLLLATALTGAFLTGDLFNLFVFAELLVITGTTLTAASDDRFGTEAAYKYYYMSLLASTFMLLAIGSLYVSYGTLNMADMAARVAARPDGILLAPAIALLMATFMIKSAVFPFHFWQPDFHAAAPTAVSAMLSSVVVKVGVYGFLRMTTLLFVAQAPLIRGILLALGVAGVVFGGLSAVGTHNVKRMLAYSTLAQVGFILVGIGWGTAPAIAAAVVFSFNHSLIKAAMLMLAGYVASRAPVKSASFEIVTGVGRYLPSAGLLFLLGGLALSGIPPTNGFVSKMLLFRSGIDAEEYVSLLIIGVASILTLVYVIRAFQLIWWHAPHEGTTAKATGDSLLAPALLIGLVLLLGIWAEPLVKAAMTVSEWLLNPALYLAAVSGAGG